MKVTTKWGTDGQLAVLYKIGNVLAFYTTANDPHFKKEQDVQLDEFQKSNPYKSIVYSAQALPSDSYIDVGFAWSNK